MNFKNVNKSKVFAFILLAWLFIPDLVLLIAFGNGEFPELKDFSGILKNTFIQAFCSATLSVILGIFGGLGLLAFENSEQKILNRKRLTYLFLIPNIFPSLFIILSVLSLVPKLEYGLFAIILIHTIVNTGLAAVLLVTHIETKLGKLAEISWVEGATFWSFFKVGILQMLKKEIFYIWGFVFTVTFMSFSVPLIVGGVNGTTFEVAIYEQIVVNGKLSAAVNLSLAQALFLIAFGFFPSDKKIPLSQSYRNFSLVAKKWMVIPSVIFSLIIFISPIFSLQNGILQLGSVNLKMERLIPLVFGTLQVALLTGTLIFLMGVIVCFTFQEFWMRKLLKGFNTPSVALIGLIFYLLPKWLFISPSVNVSVGLSILFFPIVYKILIETNLDSLHYNILNSLQMGASEDLIGKSIIFPQMANSIGFAAGLTSFWAAGDFALSSMAASNEFTLGLLIKNLMGHYRIDAAQLLVILLLVVGLCCFSIFVGVGRVCSQKSFL